MYTDEETITHAPKQRGDNAYKTYHRQRRKSGGCCRIVVIIPVLLFVTIVVAWLMAMTESMALAKRRQETHWTYSTVTGYFLQDEEDTDAQKFDYVSTNFGLINRTYDHDATLAARHGGEDDDEEEEPAATAEDDEQLTQWQRFERQIRAMNAEAEPNVYYKVLYLGRHGEGFHNVAQSWYGDEAWDCYWSLLDGNETMTWDDARLTEVGKAQAQTAHDTWRRQLENKVPFPEAFYVSPLNRCLQTAYITFDGLDRDIVIPFRPVVKELVRETMGIHTCDRRSTKSAIQQEYPEYIIDDTFTETDELWEAEWRESNSARNARIKQFLDDIFTTEAAQYDHDNDENNNSNVQFISVTAHSGAITSILEVVGHRKFGLQTGGVIPVLVRAERVPGKEPEAVIEPPTGKPECQSDPLKAGGEGPLQVREAGVDL